MNIVLRIFLLIAILTFLSCGNWFDWVDKDGAGDAEDILIDAQMAFERGDYNTAIKYYTNCIDELSGYDKPKIYYNAESASGVSKIQFWDAYWTEKTDIAKNKILVQAYAGRATAGIRKVLNIADILEIVIALNDDEEKDNNASKNIIEVIFNSNDCKSNPAKCYERGSELYKYFAPKVRDDNGNLILKFDNNGETNIKDSNRVSVGEDLLRAAKYSGNLQNYSQAIDYNLNFAVATLISVIFNILDTSGDGQFWDYDNNYPQTDDAIIVYGDLNINIKNRAYYIDNFGKDPGNLYRDTVESFQKSFCSSSDSSCQQSLPPNLAATQKLLQDFDKMIEIMNMLKDFQNSLKVIVEYTIDAFEDIILKYVGFQQDGSTGKEKPQTIVNSDGVVVYSSDTDTDIPAREPKPQFKELQEKITDLYFDMFKIDKNYNENKLQYGISGKSDSKQYTTLYGVIKAVDDFMAMFEMLKAMRVTLVALEKLYKQNPGLEGITLDQLLANPSNFIDALKTDSDNDGIPDLSVDDKQKIYDFLNTQNDELFGADPGNETSGDLDACTEYQIKSALCSDSNNAYSGCPPECPSGCSNCN